jgi:serine protease Do
MRHPVFSSGGLEQMKRFSSALGGLVLGVLLGGLVASHYLHGDVAPPPAIPKELTSYRDIVKKVLPGVVSIEARARTRRRGDEQTLGYGSGVLVDPKGVVLTNFHVVDGADRLVVTLTDGRTFSSREVKSDPKTDLAVIRLDPKKDLPYLELGDSDAMEVGDRVLAVGAPFGLSGSVTHGIISAKNRNLRVNMYEDFLQTDAAINPGNSGGPLISLEGKVIGINSAIKSQSGGFQGVGLAISSNLAGKIMERLLKDGSVHRGYLGISIKDVDNDDDAAKLGLKAGGRGVLVEGVFEDAPGGKAGLKKGDVIVSLAGRTVKDSKALVNTVADLPLGKSVALDVVRDGKPRTLDVTIEEQPADYGRRSADQDDK